MSKEDFEERLKRIEGGTAVPKTVAKPAPASDKREKLRRALVATDRAGISRTEAYPPVLSILYKLGFTPKPMFYWSVFSLMVLGGTVMFAIFGGILYSGIGSFIQSGPVAGLYEIGWDGVYALSLFAAIVFPIYIKVRAKMGSLPQWRDL
ncbi:DUF6404 family protein [Ruegeria arenilitoris]|uniref:DUF6404 family protein n=1 Tax=Ruegeria arenilitoris TaxID=1173585 RepID=UPI00147D8E8A|nr:DUF6404 family protein [Ruegeria arenilitoris]